MAKIASPFVPDSGMFVLCEGTPGCATPRYWFSDLIGCCPLFEYGVALRLSNSFSASNTLLQVTDLVANDQPSVKLSQHVFIVLLHDGQQ